MNQYYFFPAFRSVVAGCCVFLCSIAFAGENIDPRGIFFNRFSGGFSGTEWFQTIPVAGENRYSLNDIFGGGFTATITLEGVITLDGGVGNGSFSDPDNYVITPDLGGTVFTFVNNRAPLTSPNFPLQLSSPRPANTLLAGNWNNVLQTINPETGVIGPPSNELLTLTTAGNTLRITDPGGLFFQGVFENGVQVAYRRIVPDPTGVFASFPDSDINFAQDMLGETMFLNVNEFVAFFLLQSRAPLGSQVQQMFRFTAARVNPFPFGDVNGDQVVNLDDRLLIEMQLGLDIEDDNFNLAADLDSDGVITTNDLALFDDEEVILVTGFEEEALLGVSANLVAPAMAG